MSLPDQTIDITTLIDHFNLYIKSHPNLVNCWTTYLELKKKHYETAASAAAPSGHFVANDDYKIILNHLKCGEKDYTNEDIMRVLLFKASLLDDSLIDKIR